MTPAYGIKHWWRAARGVGESLKTFARRYAVWCDGRPVTNTAKWLTRKAQGAKS